MLTTVAYWRKAGLRMLKSTASRMTASTTTMRWRPIALTMGLLVKALPFLLVVCMIRPPYFLRALERMSANTARATMMPVMMYW